MHPDLAQELARAQRYLKLRGKYIHECPDWDFALIDETTPEWQSCSCYYHPPPNIALWIALSIVLWIVVILAANYIFGIDLLPL